VTAVVVVGFHRSGTSMLTRMLHKAGLFVGDRLLGAVPSNPHGHYEDEEVLGFHDKVLESNGCNWMFSGDADNLIMSEAAQRWMRTFVGRRNTRYANWGFKDPRVCLFLENWDSAIENPVYVVVFRDFLETSQSIFHRQSRDIALGQGNPGAHVRFWKEPNLALQMWVAHNRAIVNFLRKGRKRIICAQHRQLLAGFPISAELRKHGVTLDDVSSDDLVDLSATNIEVEWLLGLSGAELDEALNIWKEIEDITGASLIDIEERVHLAKAATERIYRDARFSSSAMEESETFREYNRLFVRMNPPKAPATAAAAKPASPLGGRATPPKAPGAAAAAKPASPSKA